MIGGRQHIGCDQPRRQLQIVTAGCLLLAETFFHLNEELLPFALPGAGKEQPIGRLTLPDLLQQLGSGAVEFSLESLTFALSLIEYCLQLLDLCPLLLESSG